jgi:hypothetical protein
LIELLFLLTKYLGVEFLGQRYMRTYERISL